MKTNNLTRGLSLLLALALCLSMFAGLAPTTVLAAGNESDVYLIAYPREGDANEDGDWGHPELHYMNGWTTNAATTNIVRPDTTTSSSLQTPRVPRENSSMRIPFISMRFRF